MLMEDPQSWPIRSLHQIEVTSRCNLRCVYCTHPNLGRPKQDMDALTFSKALEWVKHYVAKGTQGELNLAGTGESTLHPQLVEYVKQARLALGWDQRLLFTTNGLLVDDGLVAALKPYRVGVFVSLHRPEAAKNAVDLLRDAGMLLGVSVDPAMSAVDWAGQVDWQVTTPAFGSPCDWRKQGWCMVLSDGRITQCCFGPSSEADGIIGHVNHAVGEVVSRPYKLCRSCHLDVGIEGWRDRVEGRKVVA
jgi:hypothetical protein